VTAVERHRARAMRAAARAADTLERFSPPEKRAAPAPRQPSRRRQWAAYLCLLALAAGLAWFNPGGARQLSPAVWAAPRVCNGGGP
jgi:ferric-dicitrate binding protein FerR (iron transport regulator)